MPTYPVDEVLQYGTHREQIADLRVPGGRATRAVVLLVHGGFWRQEYDRHHTDPIAADLAERGYAVVSLEYRRLGGDGGWPATFDDLATAVDVLPSLLTAAAPAVAGVPVVALGHSAGGHLVLWTAGRHRLRPASRWHRPVETGPAGPRPWSTVALAPVADLSLALRLDLDDGVVSELLGTSDPPLSQRLAELDPMGLPPAGAVVLLHGDQDAHVPIELSRRYVDVTRRHDADVTLESLPGVEHFALIEPGSAAWLHVLGALERVAGPA